MTTLTKLDKRIKEYQWLSHKVIEGVEALKQENERLKAKNTDLLQEWSVQAVECQELVKENEELGTELARVKAFKDDLIETSHKTTSFWYDKWYEVTHK